MEKKFKPLGSFNRFLYEESYSESIDNCDNKSVDIVLVIKYFEFFSDAEFDEYYDFMVNQAAL